MGSVDVKFDHFDGWIMLRHLRRLHKFNLQQLQRYAGCEKERIACAIDLLGEEHSEIADLYSSAKIEQALFEQLECQNAFMSAFAAFEHCLVRTADNLISVKKSTIERKKLRGSPLEASKKIIVTLGGVSSLFDDKRWKRISLYQKLRNKLAHAAALLEAEEPLVKDIADLPGVTFEEFGDGEHFKRICLSPCFVAKSFQDFSGFADDLGEVARVEDGASV